MHRTYYVKSAPALPLELATGWGGCLLPANTPRASRTTGQRKTPKPRVTYDKPTRLQTAVRLTLYVWDEEKSKPITLTSTKSQGRLSVIAASPVTPFIRSSGNHITYKAEAC